LVLTKVKSPPQDSVKKLYPKYVGPYKVIRVHGPVLIIEPLYAHPNARKTVYQVHVDRVRPCSHDYPNVHTWQELTSPFARAADLDANIDSEAEESE
jgi:hypothetical protein